MRYVSVLLILCLVCVRAFGLQITTYPTIQFGSISYGSSVSTGKNSVTVSPSGTVSTAGSGGIVTQTGGAAGKVAFKSTSVLELLVNVRVASSTPQVITTPGCGSITVNNFVLAGSLNLLTLTFLLGAAETTVGATMTVNNITGYNCTISGTVNGALAYSTLAGDTNPNTPLNVNISVNVLPPPLTLKHSDGASLNFGTLCRGSATQTLTVAADGTASGSNLVCPAQGYSADQFKVDGYNGASFSVSSISSIQLTNSADGTKLTVDNFTPSCSSNCIISANDFYILRVGGRLTVPASATAGTYTGTYPVTITY